MYWGYRDEQNRIPALGEILILCHILPHTDSLFSHTVNVQLDELAQTEDIQLLLKTRNREHHEHQKKPSCGSYLKGNHAFFFFPDTFTRNQSLYPS